MAEGKVMGGGQNAVSSSGKPRLLIVDDHEMIRYGIRMMVSAEPDLELCGEASNEPAAMDQFRRLRPDLVIVDIALENGNGIELIKRIKTIDRSARIVVYSMYDEKTYGERALCAGAMGYVTKQSPSRTILHAVRRVLEGRLYFSEELTQHVLERSAGKQLQPPSMGVEDLSDRELEVFLMIGEGLTPRTIAERLHLSPRTIDTYRERLKSKLHVDSAAELHHRAVRWVVEGW